MFTVFTRHVFEFCFNRDTEGSIRDFVLSSEGRKPLTDRAVIGFYIPERSCML